MCGSALIRKRTETAETMCFHPQEMERKAWLVVVRGTSATGQSYCLEQTEEEVGRESGTVIFDDDMTVSPRHALFKYEGQRLYLKDLTSHNGTYLRIRKPIPLKDGDVFLAGEQVLKFTIFRSPDPPTEGQARFCGTPLRPWRMQITQLLAGGVSGAVYPSRRRKMEVGRSHCDVSFPDDPYISGRHCRIEEENGEFFLHDLQSRNGTFFRLAPEIEVGLQEGDHVFIGRQVLRVGMSVADELRVTG